MKRVTAVSIEASKAILELSEEDLDAYKRRLEQQELECRSITRIGLGFTPKYWLKQGGNQDQDQDQDQEKLAVHLESLVRVAVHLGASNFIWEGISQDEDQDQDQDQAMTFASYTAGYLSKQSLSMALSVKGLILTTTLALKLTLRVM